MSAQSLTAPIHIYRGEQEDVTSQSQGGALAQTAAKLVTAFSGLLKLENAEGEIVRVDVHDDGAIALRSYAEAPSGKRTPMSAVVLTCSQEVWSSETVQLGNNAEGIGALCTAILQEVAHLPPPDIQLTTASKAQAFVEQNNKLLAEMAAEISRLDQRIATLQTQLSSAQQEVLALRFQLQRAQHENTDLHAQLQHQDEHIQKLTAELEGFHKEREEALHQAEQAQKQLEEHQQLLDSIGLRPISPPSSVVSVFSVASQSLSDIIHDDNLLAIAEGRLETLFAASPEATNEAVSHLLWDLLENEQQSPAVASAIYNLAFYLVNHDPNRLQSFQNHQNPGTPLYNKLRTWLIARNAAGLLNGEAERQDHLCAALAPKINTQLEDLVLPIKFIRLKNDLAANDDLSDDEQLFLRLLGSDDQVVEAARAYLQTAHPATPLDALIRGLIAMKVNPLEAQFTENSLCLPSLAAGSHDSIGAMNQLLKLPEVNHRAGSLPSWTVDLWETRRAKREEALDAALRAPISEDDFIDIVSKQRSDAFLKYRHGPQGVQDDAVAFLQQENVPFNEEMLFKDGALSPFANMQLATLRQHFQQRLETLTGFHAQDPGQIAEEFCRAIAENRVPPLIERLAMNGDGSEALALMQLAYYYTALSHLNPAKPQFAGIAKDTDWNWLLSPNTPDGIHACILTRVIRAFYTDIDDLRGSVLTAHQVQWVNNIFSVLRGGKGNHIYDRAGNGKTVTARFAIRLAKALQLEDRELHLFSPFGYKDRHGDLVCHQYLPGAAQLTAQGSPNDGALVDEAQALSPAVEIVLEEDNVSAKVEPLHMTATPVIPIYRTLDSRKIVLEKLSLRAQQMQEQLQQLNQAIEQGAAQHLQQYRAQLNAAVQASLPALLEYADYLPRPIAQRLKNAVRGPLTEASIREILKSLSILLMPHQIKKSAAVSQGDLADTILFPLQDRTEELHLSQIVRDGRLPQSHVWLKNVAKPPLGHLQSLEQRPYEKAIGELFPIANTVLALRRALAADLDSLPQEIQDQLPGMVKLKMGQRTRLSAEYRAVRKKIASLQEKSQHALSAAEKAHRDYLHGLKRAETEMFDTIDYHQAALTTFSPAAALAAANAAFQQQQPGDHIQLLFPGTRFTQANFPQLLQNLSQAQALQGKTVYFLYHDSHSPQDSLTYGQKRYVKMGELQSHPLTELQPEPDATIVMLYDTTNKQGGDFNGYSLASQEHDVSQYLFYQFRETDASPDPSATTSEHDLYQAIRRCRGKSENSPVVCATCDEVAPFLQGVKTRQNEMERAWATRDAAFQISKKLLKLYLLIADPQRFQQYQVEKQERQQKQEEDDRDSQPLIVTKDPRSAQRLVSTTIPEIAQVDLVQSLQPIITKAAQAENSQQALELMAQGLQVAQPIQRMVRGALSPPKQDERLWRIEKLRTEIGLLAFQAATYRPMAAEVII